MADSLNVLTTPLGKQPLVCRMKTFDALSQPFRYELELVSPGATPDPGSEPEIKPGDLLGKTITVSLTGKDVGKTVRHFHGYVAEFRKENLHPDEPRRRVLYRVVLRPWLWLLGLRTNCRVFHDSSAVDIVKKICAEHGFGDLIVDERRESPQAREYVVQYNESDLAFVNRLLERDGIYYYFTHSEAKHQLVLADDPTSHALQPENGDYPSYRDKVDEYRYIKVWHETNHLRPSDYRLDDYDFLAPTTDLEVKLKTDQPHVYDKGTQFRYPGGYTKREAGEEFVKYSLQAQNAGAAHVSGTAQALGLTSGSTFTTKVSPGHEYLVIRAESELFFNDYAAWDSIVEEQKRQSMDISPDITCRFTAIDKETPFRPERRTPRPVIAGVQTAKVVGIDDGALDGSIHIDDHGRVMVKFHWLNASGADAAAQRSCWVRVAQAWAGNAWGTQFTPRVGSEVIVSFEEGDPERPLVVGSAYNGLWHAPFQADGAVDGTISGLKTDRAVNGGTSEEEPNVLSFDDVEGQISMSGQGIGVTAEKTADITGDKVVVTGGVGGTSKVEVGGPQQSISVFSANTLTLQTLGGKIELNMKGIDITGLVTVNLAAYPVPPTPALVAAVRTEALTNLGMDAATGAVGA